jgi:hypothetical protein
MASTHVYVDMAQQRSIRRFIQWLSDSRGSRDTKLTEFVAGCYYFDGGNTADVYFTQPSARVRLMHWSEWRDSGRVLACEA